MIIQCNHCSARFKIDDSKLVNGPVKVRCARCKEIFVVQPPAPAPENSAVHLPTVAPSVAESAATKESSLESPSNANEPAAPDAVGHSLYSGQPRLNAEAASGPVDDSSDEFDWKAGTVPGFDESSADSDFDLSSFEASLAAAGGAAGSESALAEDDDFDFGDVELSTKSESPPVAASTDVDDFSMDFGEISFSGQSTDKVSSPDTFPGSSPEDDAVFPDFSPPSAEPFATDEEAPGSPNFSEFSLGAKAEPIESETKASGSDWQDESKGFAALDFSDGILDEELPPSSLTSRKKSGSLFPLVVITGAIILIVALAGSGVYFFGGPKAFTKIGLGFLDEWSGNKAAEEGSIALKGLTASYIVNSTAGELFVVRGEAVNNFNKPRASIQIKVSIFGAGGVNLVTRSAYCGNFLSDEQLATLPLEKIEEVLNNQFGDSLANLGLKPGGTIPFVVVVNPLPKESTDYSVVVGGSTIATQ